MRHILPLMCLLLANAASAGDQPVRVIDGDSLRIGERNIRIWGLDAPEWNQPGGRQATAVMNALVAAGGSITCRTFYLDRYGRDVARCVTEHGRDLACEMIRSGAARDYTYYSDGYYKPCEP